MGCGLACCEVLLGQEVVVGFDGDDEGFGVEVVGVGHHVAASDGS